MPVEEGANITFGTDGKTLDKLDKEAKRANDVIDKRNRSLKRNILLTSRANKESKRLAGRGGIFGGATQDPVLPRGGGSPRDLRQPTTQDKRTRKRLDRLTKQNNLLRINQASQNKKFFNRAFGAKIGKNLYSFARSPKAFIFNTMKALPILGGILVAADLARFIIDEIIKLDTFFKAFIDIVDNRIDKFISLQEQANIQAGLQQRVITTAAGTTEPRYAYNTLNEFNNNQDELEINFQMTNNSGA